MTGNRSSATPMSLPRLPFATPRAWKMERNSNFKPDTKAVHQPMTRNRSPAMPMKFLCASLAPSRLMSMPHR
eukprot:558131-Alexandrium_andersonii.AAC.1